MLKPGDKIFTRHEDAREVFRRVGNSTLHGFAYLTIFFQQPLRKGDICRDDAIQDCSFDCSQAFDLGDEKTVGRARPFGGQRLVANKREDAV